MLDRYKSIIDQAKSAELETLSAWYSYFKMKENPFLDPIPENVEFYVDQKKLVESIVYFVGVASRGIPLTILLVGCKGSGKSATLIYINSILSKLSKDPSRKYIFNGCFVESDDLFRLADELDELDDDNHETSQDIQMYLKLCKKKLDFLFVDDAKPIQIRTILKKFTKTKLKLFTVSPLDFDKIISEMVVTPEIKYHGTFGLENAILMLNKRLEIFLPEEDRISVSDLFEKDSLKILVDYCRGVPKLILECVSKSMELAMRFNERPISSETVTQACKINKVYYAKENLDKVRKSKLDILRNILESEKTPTELSSFMMKDRSTISRHLNDLKEMGLVTMHKRGRDSVYRITEPTRIHFELNIISQREEKDASM